MKTFLMLVSALMPAAETAVAETEAADGTGDRAGNAWDYHVRLNKFERQFSTRGDDQHAEWAGFMLLSRDLNHLWLTTKGETKRGLIDSAEIRLFYGYTVTPHVDVHLGWRRDIEPEPNRDWIGFGLLGVLPYKVGSDVSLFVGESGRLAARVEVAWKYRFTDRLSLTPDVEANFYSESDPATGIGSGLADLDLGLRLRYRIINGLAPYAGVTWKGNFGGTADQVEDRGEDDTDLRLLLGVTLWF